MSILHRFSFPTTIHFGAGARRLVPEHLVAQGKHRPLVVTDQGVEKLPFFAELVRSLRDAGLEPAVYGGVQGNPVESQVTAGGAVYRSHHADCIVGIGGGAALDVAKALAVMANHPGPLFDYEDEKPGARAIDGTIPYWVAIPTTAGTGSEVGRSAVVSDETTHRKKIIFSPRLLAQAVFADPELTVGLPGPMTAATGMDALTHLVESYLARGYHPLCDGIALEGLRLVGANLRRVMQEPGDIEARGGMLMASMMGAIAFQKGLGITHSVAHALGTVTDMHHGLANGIMIDHALRHNVEGAKERFVEMARTLHVPNPSAESFFHWLRDLKHDLGIPKDLEAAGIDDSKLEALVDVAVEDGCHANNPVPCTRADFERIFTHALHPERAPHAP